MCKIIIKFLSGVPNLHHNCHLANQLEMDQMQGKSVATPGTVLVITLSYFRRTAIEG